MPLLADQVEFPIGFAETSQNIQDDNAIFYVEWLNSESDFPDLSTRVKKVDEIEWEVVEQKEIEDKWSEVNTFDIQSYLEIAEKDADLLKPTKRSLQPLWPQQPRYRDKQEEFTDGEEVEQEHLDAIYHTHKSQRKITFRSDHLTKIRNLKHLDLLFPGTYLQGISESEEPVTHLAAGETGEDWYFDSKAEAVKYASMYKFYSEQIYPPYDKRYRLDYTEYSILDAQKKRFRTKFDL